MMQFIGIDPGKTGAVAIVGPGVRDLAVYPTPVLDKGYNIPSMFNLLAPFSGTGCRCVIERAQAMPKQGTVSMFEFGRGYGIWLGLLVACGISYQTVHPRVWTRVMLDGARGEGKERAVLRAQEIFGWSPALKKQWAYADAILLAEYARRLVSGGMV